MVTFLLGFVDVLFSFNEVSEYIQTLKNSKAYMVRSYYSVEYKERKTSDFSFDLGFQ